MSVKISLRAFINTHRARIEELHHKQNAEFAAHGIPPIEFSVFAEAVYKQSGNGKKIDSTLITSPNTNFRPSSSATPAITGETEKKIQAFIRNHWTGLNHLTQNKNAERALKNEPQVTFMQIAIAAYFKSEELKSRAQRVIATKQPSLKEYTKEHRDGLENLMRRKNAARAVNHLPPLDFESVAKESYEKYIELKAKQSQKSLAAEPAEPSIEDLARRYQENMRQQFNNENLKRALKGEPALDYPTFVKKAQEKGDGKENSAKQKIDPASEAAFNQCLDDAIRSAAWF